jgi:hypothetical protein
MSTSTENEPVAERYQVLRDIGNWLKRNRTIISTSVTILSLGALLIALSFLANSEKHEPQWGWLGDILLHVGSFVVASFLVHLVYYVALRDEIGDRHAKEIRGELARFKADFEDHSDKLVKTLSSNATKAFADGIGGIYQSHEDYRKAHPFDEEVVNCRRVRSIARTFGGLFRPQRHVTAIVDAMQSGCNFEFAMLSSEAALGPIAPLLSMGANDIPTAFEGLLVIQEEYLKRCHKKKISGTLELRFHGVFLPYSTMEFERGDKSKHIGMFPRQDFFCDHFFDTNDKAICGLAWDGPLCRKLRGRAAEIWNLSTLAYKLADCKVWGSDNGRISPVPAGQSPLDTFKKRFHELAGQ